MRILLSLLFFIINSFGLVIINNPNDRVVVNISKTSVNRLVLPSKILDVTYSKEKGLNIKIIGNQAFLKYIPIKKQEYQVVNNQKRPIGEPKIVYDNAKTSEVYFVTEDKTFSFVFVPKKKKPETIIVNDFVTKAKKVIKYETEDNYILSLSKISKTILKGKLPFGYKLKEINKVIYQDKIFITKLVNEYKGVIYKVYLYSVKNKSNKPVRLSVKALYNLSHNTPKAISIYYGNKINYLLPYGEAKVLILEGNNVR